VGALVPHREELAVNAQDPDSTSADADDAAAFLVQLLHRADPIAHETILHQKAGW
jgi:hypothetical protein